ncbi:MAG TPA: TonB family protein, partial [Patescibacteria group bacterium]|nr:TonB family protein [Patescibacteria group bacterium]
TEGGQIKDIGIAESSGYPLLDSAAISAIKDASPYPFPKDYKGDLEIVLPINYQQPRSYLRKTLASRILAKHDYTQKTVPQPQEAAPTAEKTSLIPSEKPLPPAAAAATAETISGQPNVISAELSSFVEVALKNNQPTQVAREEVELAQIKIAEAKRNFFPGLKAWAYSTDGQVNHVNYQEREARLELSQPLFYGGRLGDTYNQARVNMEITRRNYERLKFDVMHKTETAYYNLVAAKMHLESKEAVRKEAREILAQIEKLAAAGMIIPLEASSARSWFDQLEFEVDNIKQDLFMAELTFKQVLNINYAPLIEGALIEAKPFDFDLNQLSDIARKYRPEVAVSKLLVAFQEYGQKIETKKKNDLNVDLVGSYGKYTGHYVTEPWQNSSNWYAGLKVTKPLGSNTINSSYTKENVQPRFGQTSPTSSATLNSEFNVMDNLKRLSDKKRADIDLHRALSDYNETIKTINFEVQDALLNYQKALLQLNTAEAEMKFRRNEVDLTKARSMVADASLSSTMESLFQFSEAQSRYMRALANYRLTLTNLKKACGYGIEI